jgi:acetolactate decarboxylase
MGKLAVLGMGAVGILTSCGGRAEGEAVGRDDELFQVGTLAGLAAGGYDGLATVADLVDHGDFGLGTFDGLDGEMIVLDGAAFQVPASGLAQQVDGTLTTPFAAVTTWDTDSRYEYAGATSCADLQTAVDQLIDLDTPYAVKVTGQFSSLQTRSVDRQTSPYRPLADALAGQVEFTLGAVTATLVGFRLPDHMAESNAAGYHFHALTDARDAGGHVLDCRAVGVTVELDAIDSWQVELPPS